MKQETAQKLAELRANLAERRQRTETLKDGMFTELAALPPEMAQGSDKFRALLNNVRLDTRIQPSFATAKVDAHHGLTADAVDPNKMLTV